MSLINKLLTDLEERHTVLNGRDEVVLDGLTAVTGRGNKQQKKIPIDFLVVSFFLITSISVAYGVIHDNKKSALSNTYSESPVVKSENDSKSQNEMEAVHSELAKPVKTIVETKPSPSELKLEVALTGETPVEDVPVSASVISEAYHIVVKDMSLVEENNNIDLRLKLNGKARYNAYTLSSPDRVVLEIDDVDFSASIPDVDHIEQIQGIRMSNNPGYPLKLVIDADQPLSIEGTNLIADAEAYILDITLHPLSGNTEIPGPKEMPEDLVLQKGNSFIDEEKFGQINVKRTDNTDNSSLSERLFREAVLLYQKRNIQKANQKLFDVLELEPLHVSARLLLASKMLEQKDINNAERLLRLGLDINPTIPEWAKLYAHILVLKGRNAEAVKALMNAISSAGDDAEFDALLAALLQKESRHEEAVRLYKKVVNLDPTNGVWWMGLAISLDALDRTDEALHAYNQSLKGKGMTQDLHRYVYEQISRLTTHHNS